jgi:hypothetical protein
MKNPCAILMLAVSMSGCAITPTSSTEATPVPGWNHVAFAYPGSNTVPVLVIRDNGFWGGACSTRISVNGELAALVSPGEKVLLHVPAGEVFIGAEPAAICGGGLVERRAETVRGKPLYFRVSYESLPESLLLPIYVR